MNPNNPENNDTVILELDRPRELRLTHKVMKRFCANTYAAARSRRSTACACRS